MKNLSSLYGSMVFNDSVMQQRLPSVTYRAIKNTIDSGEPLDISIANIAANAMKDWATEMGATHFTHWFQPMILCQLYWIILVLRRMRTKRFQEKALPTH